MVWLSHLNGTPFVVNLEVIATIEATPDTLVTLLNGTKLLVRESVVEVVARAVAFRLRIANGDNVGPLPPPPGG